MKRIVSFLLFILISINMAYAYEKVEEKEVRTAEFAVVQKCWNCKTAYTAFIENDTEGIKEIIDFTANDWSCTFLSYTYYTETYVKDGISNLYDVAILLTNEGVARFINLVFEPHVLDNIQTQVYDSSTGTYSDYEPGIAERARMMALLEEKVNEIRRKYKEIRILLPDGEETFYFVRTERTEPVDTTVFSADAEKKLLIFKTDQYRDVFCQAPYEPIPEGTDVEPAFTSEEHFGDAFEYRMTDVSFWLCENCSKCDDCEGYVACGIDDNEIGQYFSNYCGKHACHFVWECLADPTNSGCQEEGLKCIERHNYPSAGGFCPEHRCKACFKPIVGLSRVGAQFDDIRLTGNANRGNYSNFCADHKCRAYMCPNIRIGQNVSGNGSKSAEHVSPLYCAKHSTGCKHIVNGTICGNSVSNSDYELSGKMLCKEHSKLADEYTRYMEALKGTPYENCFVPKLVSCMCCDMLDVSYWNGDDGGICAPCLNEELWKEQRNMAKLAGAGANVLLQNGNDITNRFSRLDWIKNGKVGIDIYNSDLSAVAYDANIILTRSQYYSSIQLVHSKDEIGAAIKEDSVLKEGVTLLRAPNCSTAGLNAFAIVANNWGLPMPSSKGTFDKFELTKSFVATTEYGDFRFVDPDTGGSGETGQLSCTFFPEISRGGQASSAFSSNGEYVYTNASEFEAYIAKSFVVNETPVGEESPNHTWWPAGEVTMYNPAAGTENKGVLVYESTQGTWKQNNSKPQRAMMMTAREDSEGNPICDENGNQYFDKVYLMTEPDTGKLVPASKVNLNGEVEYVVSTVSSDTLQRKTYESFSIQGSDAKLDGWEEARAAKGFVSAQDVVDNRSQVIEIVRQPDGTYKPETVELPTYSGLLTEN